MDTIITDRPEIQVDDGPGEDRLRAFRPVEASDRPSAASRASRPAKKGRQNGLLIGASTVAVLAVGAGMFWISPYNHYTLHDATKLATQVRDLALNTPPRPVPLVAPAAQLARAPDPTPVPPRYKPTPPAPQPIAGGDDMAEFLRLGGQSAPPPPPIPPRPVANVVTASPTAAKADQSVPTVPSEAVRSAPSAAPRVESAAAAKPLPQEAHPAAQVTHVADVAKPAATPAVTVEAPKPASLASAAPQDAVAKIAELRPAPMTEPQQVQVLQLVTDLGTLVRDQRAEIAQLRQDQQNLDQRVDGSLTDFGRRLSLAEARGAVNAAMSMPATLPQTTPAAPAPVATAVGLVVAKATAPAATVADTTPQRYHVQAASPGLAMLSALDASGGEEQQLPVSPGDSVPGWGKVISISQRGATWIVKTDHGVIQ